MRVKPWSKESEMIFKQLSKNGKAYTKDTKGLPVQFGHRCKEIINKDMLDIATIRNKKEKRTWFVTPPEIKIISRYNKKRGNFFDFINNNHL